MKCLVADCTAPALYDRKHCDEHVVRCRDCLRPAVSRNLCARCYRNRVALGTLPKGRLCGVDGCDRPSRSRGMCVMHYKRWKETPADKRPDAPLLRSRHLCCVPGCDRLSRSRDMCEMHYQRNKTRVGRDACRKFSTVENLSRR